MASSDSFIDRPDRPDTLVAPAAVLMDPLPHEDLPEQGVVDGKLTRAHHART
jgi:hypothetical protein